MIQSQVLLNEILRNLKSWSELTPYQKIPDSS